MPVTATTRLIANKEIPACFFEETPSVSLKEKTPSRTLKNGINIDPSKPGMLHTTFNDVGLVFDIAYDQNGMRFSDGQEYFYVLNSNSNLGGKSISSVCPNNSVQPSHEASAVLFYFPEQPFSIIIEPTKD